MSKQWMTCMVLVSHSVAVADFIIVTCIAIVDNDQSTNGDESVSESDPLIDKDTKTINCKYV